MSRTHKENGERVSENWDSVFNCLSSEPRRQLVLSLLDASPDESVPLPESAVMPNVPADPELLRRDLHHVHLPMLAKHGFVTTDTDPFVAARGPRFDEAGVVLDAVQSSASGLPDALVVGCRRLEAVRQTDVDVS
jgi:hypothetical protein